MNPQVSMNFNLSTNNGGQGNVFVIFHANVNLDLNGQ